MGQNCKYFNKAKAQGDGRKQRMPKTLGKMERKKNNEKNKKQNNLYVSIELRKQL